MRSLERSAAGIGALAEPVRRELYRFVCSQTQPVSRDQAAQAVGIARHRAKFHLDRLEDEGLLEADYVRLTGRSGPGAGRPAKRYRRGGTEFAVAIPEREYELAGWLMADAIAASGRAGDPVRAALDEAAAAHGAAIAAAAADHPTRADDALDFAVRVLAEHAYEPRRTGSAVVMANCPFHGLARSHRELICGMNRSLLAGFVRSIATDLLELRLDPGDNRCCFTLTAVTVIDRRTVSGSNDSARNSDR